MIEYTPALTTLDYVRLKQALEDGNAFEDSTSVNTLLVDLIGEASAEFAAGTERVAVPYLDTYTFDYGGQEMLNLRTLYAVSDDLLEVTELSNAGTVIASSNYVLRTDRFINNRYPKNTVVLKENSGVTWQGSGNPEDAVSITAWWGYAPQYQRQWVSAGTLPQELSSSATSLVLAGLFEVLQYIKINDEVLQITAIDTDTDTLTLTRGEQGTTAATHAVSSVVYRWQQLADINGAVAEMARFKYKTLNATGGRITLISNGVIQVQDIDPSVPKTLSRHRRANFYIV